jgi:thiol-disulfide isomerase/thioredoxin
MGGYFMFLRRIYFKKTGRTYLCISEAYRDQNGKPKSKIIQSVGYLDELEKDYADPIAHFTDVAKRMTREASKEILLRLNANILIERSASNRKNYGHIIFSRIYHELELDRFFNNKARHAEFEYNANSIMKLLVFARLIYPGSKKNAHEMKGRFFDILDFTLDDVYNSLSFFDRHALECQRFMHERIAEKYGRDTDLVYYDVTNYYFETEHEDDLRKKGYSKEHRRDPIVQMGLAMDKKGIPLSYKLFRGNLHDSQTLMPVLSEIVKEYGAKRVIAVADKGLNSGDNIVFNTALGHGYVFSQSVRGAGEEMKAYILDEAGYTPIGDDYKRKSRTIPAIIQYSPEPGKKRKIQLDQKQVVFYSKKYAIRAKRKRAEVLLKAADLIANPSKYKRTTAQGAAGYISGIAFDKKTGEVLDTGQALLINEEKIREEEKMDGYYAIVTSEMDEPDDKIIDMYRGLWRIEESFKITKSVLEARPVYVYKPEHINAHFLSCFISLTLARLVELKLGGNFPISRIVESLREVSCSHLDANHYLFNYADDVTDALNTIFDVGFGKKFMSLGEIKKYFAHAKI